MLIDKYDILREKWKKLGEDEIKANLWNFGASFSYHSGKIENDDIHWPDFKCMYEDKLALKGLAPRTYAEIVGACKAYDFFMKSLSRDTPISLDFIKQMQFLLTDGAYDRGRLEKGERPGTFKIGDYVVGRFATGSAPDRVKPELEALLDEISEIDEKNALTAATYLHGEFECIHPFADGNGRTGRLLMNYFLVQHNCPPIIVFEGDRLPYYEALDDWNAKEDIEPLRRFLSEQGVRTWIRLDKDAIKELRRAGRNTRLKDLLTQ